MQIGKAGPATSAICRPEADRITVRGHDLCGELMGTIGFTDYFHLLLTGRTASEEQRYFLDLLLVAIAEHGLVPTVQVARMTLAADPGSLHGAVAAGILGCGPVILGTTELCSSLLQQAAARVRAGEEAGEVAASLIADIRSNGARAPGFGHPLHKPEDPRAVRIFELAESRGVTGLHCALARQLHSAANAAWGKPLVMNVSMPIAAVLLDLGFPGDVVKAIPILARTASLLAHLAEEKRHPIGFTIAAHGEAAIGFDAGETD